MARLVLPQALGKSAADIMNLAVRTLDTDDQHVLGEPAFFLTEFTGDPQRQTFFGKQGVATISRADTPDRIILRIMTDKPPVHVEIGFGMKTPGEIVGAA